MLRNEILTKVQELIQQIKSTEKEEKCSEPVAFILTSLDWALSTGTEEDLARLIQPWLQNRLLGVVGMMLERTEDKQSQIGHFSTEPKKC